MKLRTALKRNRADVIRVGTKGGTGFVYIGDRKELLASGIDLLDREVVDVYAGQMEPHTVYIVDGSENGHVEYNGDPEWGKEVRQRERALEVVAAAYKEAIKELVSAYRHIIKAGTLDEVMTYAAIAVDAERFLLEDQYGAFGEGGARPIIRRLRKNAGDRIKAEGKL